MAMNGNGNGTNGKHKDPVLVVIQLSGGNDFMNTVIPYTEGVYYDVRPLVGMPEDKVLPITNTLAFHPNAGALKDLWNEGKVAIVQGIGYENSSRSHFRAMDIWHTCEPETIATEGWLAKGHPRDRPRWRKPRDGSQLRTWVATSPRRTKRDRNISRRPR